MTAAELLVLALAVGLLLWLLRPLRRRIAGALARRMGRRRPGDVIDVRFRPIPPDRKDKH